MTALSNMPLPREPGTNEATELAFTLNGQPVRIEAPDPRALLVEHLRSPAVGLTGTRLCCGQGACGACAVIVSRYDPTQGSAVHLARNACLVPLATLDGCAVTTVEGLGSTRAGLHPVQHGLALENASQCGYCTPGFVTVMGAFLASRGDKPAGAAEVERLFDGNLCRCTGYRPILDAMKRQACDTETGDTRLTCQPPPDAPPVRCPGPLPFPEELRRPARPLRYARGGRQYHRPRRVEDVLALLARRDEGREVRLIAGNTAVGLEYPAAEPPDVLVDLSCVEALGQITWRDDGLELGSGVTYTALLNRLDRPPRALPPGAKAGLDAIRALASATGNSLVRNAATIGGNLALLLERSARGQVFASDLGTALWTLGATATLASPRWSAPRRLGLPELLRRHAADGLLERALILSLSVPWTGEGDRVATFRVAERPENAGALLNAVMRVSLEAGHVRAASLHFGGLVPAPWRASEVEAALLGRRWEPGVADHASRALGAALDALGLPDDPEHRHRRRLAEAFLLRFCAEEVDRPERPPVRATQDWKGAFDGHPGERPAIRSTAFQQATGEARYAQDLPLAANGLHGALVLSDRALAAFRFQLPDGEPVEPGELRRALQERFPGVVDLLTAADLPPGGRNLQGLGGDEPLFAEGRADCAGQLLALVLADSERGAWEAAAFVERRCLAWTSLGRPILDLEEAIAAGSQHEAPGPAGPDAPSPSRVHVRELTRPGSALGWTDAGPQVRLDGQDCLVVRTRQRTGGQLHFYMETQTCLVEPDGGGGLVAWPSSQSPDDVHQGIAATLGLPHHRIRVALRPVGGSYGGKTVRAPFIASPAALGAWKHGRPVRVALPRPVDCAMVGTRHPFLGQSAIAVATGEEDPTQRGRILGMDTRLWLDGGHSLDCSFAVLTAAQLQGDNAYFVPNYRIGGEVCRTHKPSNTAFRSFGAIQTLLVQEEAIEAAAFALGMRPEDVRERNLYAPDQRTPYGQSLGRCYLRGVWRHLRERCDLDQRVRAVERFNAEHRWRKRGISMIPVKYGLGFNVSAFEQAGALLEVYAGDGSVLIRQGGAEVGQGIGTKVAQVAALELDLPLSLVRVGDTDTSVIPNPTSSGASTATALNGGAVREAARAVRARIEAFCQSMLQRHGPDWCRERRIDYWSYPQGWRTALPGPDGRPRLVWSDIVALAHVHRVNLSAQARFSQPGNTGTVSGLRFQGQGALVHEFLGYTCSAAATEVEIDVLTGETTLLRADLVQDVGRSLNPALDLGQIEGAFVQGLGYVLLEETRYQAEGPERGRLETADALRYKVPSAATLPRELNVALYPWGEGAEIPADPGVPLSAKHVSEPPLVLAATAFFAVKHAILAARRDRGLPGWFALEAPATVRRVCEACRG